MPAPHSLVRRRLIPGLLVAGSFALAFAQRPGQTVFDTRIELSADATLFLHRVAAVWSPTGDLGHVQSGQFVGYLFPMAPWFAFVQWVGLPIWVGQRLWLGVLIALAALGAVRLLDELFDRRRGVAHLAAGVLYAANPYVAVWTTRGSVALLAYAAMPWLMIAAHRGMQRPRAWRYPALIGLLLAASGAGVNAAIVLWVLPGPALLVLYEALVIGAGAAALGSFAWRAGLCALLGAAWWVIPLLLQARHGTDFLRFTELPDSVWASTSMPESLRLLGYWLLYLGVGGVSVVSLSSRYLFSAPVIVATFLVPMFAFASVRWTRRWSYGPFFCLVAVGGLVAMAGGFPAGTPLHSVLTSAYYDLEPLRLLRTSYKAAPLVGISLACLTGVGLRILVMRMRGRLSTGRRGVALGALGVAAAATLVLFALPLFDGRAIDRVQAYGSIPGGWRAAIAQAERTTPATHRIMVFPGALFGYYRWGNVVSSIAPALSKRPVLVREVVPYANAQSAQLQAAVDDLVQQGRLVPGQLDPLLQLMGVGQVMVYTDGLPAQSGSLDPQGVSEALQGQRGFGRPSATYGGSRVYRPPPGRGGSPRTLPELRAYPTPGRAAPGIVRVHPLGGATVVDGDAQGITELAADGDLTPQRALFYASDLDRRWLAGLVRGGTGLVFTDSNRRRVLESDLLRNDEGPTMGAHDPIPREWASFRLFGSRGPEAQTVARYTGLRFLRSPLDRSFPLFPDHRAYAALDGRLDTAWEGNSVSSPARRYIELGFSRPRAIGTLRVYPETGTHALGISVDRGPERRFLVRPRWNALPLHVRAARSLRVRVVAANAPSTGGISELVVPGLIVRESLRLPTVLASTARGLDLSHSPLSILLERTTADFPYRSGAGDAERGLVRDVDLPVGRSFSVGGWASAAPTAPDPLLDRLAGLRGGWSFSSSGRFEGVPGSRASSAFDGSAATAWIGSAPAGAHPWLAVHAPRPLTLRRLSFQRGAAGYRFPTRIRVKAGRITQTVGVSPGGAVRLARPVRARDLRITVLASRSATVADAARGLAAVAVSEVHLRGARPPRPPRSGGFATRCGEVVLHVRGRAATARVTGTIADLDAGRPLRLAGCGPRARLPLPAGATQLVASAASGVRPDHLELTAAAPAPLASPVAPGGIASAGVSGNSGRGHVQLNLDRPAWLVLGESYSDGWRAWCRGRSGGERGLGVPVPIDGYANGWRVDPDCREARFAFTPQRAANVGYIVSAVACLGMLALLVRPRRRRRRAGVAAAGPTDCAPVAGAARLPAVTRAAPADPVRRVRWPVAALVAVLVAGFGSFLFGPRAGIAFGLGTGALLLVGLTVRRLIAVAGLALAAVPVLYVASPAPRPNGLAFTYATHYIAAHWVAVAAVTCVGGAGVLGALAVRAAGRRDAAEQGARMSSENGRPAPATTVPPAPAEQAIEPSRAPRSL
jgi:arabinofuranan 3-O-arabinosyltransferase